MVPAIPRGNGQASAIKRSRALAAASLLALASGGALSGSQAAAASTVSPLPASNYGVRPVCAAPAPGHAACMALELVPATPAARAHTRPLGMTRSAPAKGRGNSQACELEPPTAAHACFGLRPQDLHSAYQLPGGAESSQEIAIVDPFNDPSVEADLETYDQEFGLPACTTQDGCFERVNQRGEAGKLPFPKTTTERGMWEAVCNGFTPSAKCGELHEAIEWDSEISLDVETAHGVCQNCHILLVEAASSAYPDLEEAEETAVRLGATEISDSWGESERAFGSGVFVHEAFNHPGIVITAAAGDEGYLNWRAARPAEHGVDYPASSPHVVAVGGTRLSLQEGTWTEETVWNATGGGCSTVFGAPPWQLSTPGWASVGCGENRAVADVSADADPYTGAAIYDSASRCEGHWCTLGGTSLASPLIAGVFALAGGAHGVEYPARTLYEDELNLNGSLHDIITGSNGECNEPLSSEGIPGCSVGAEAKSCSQQAICLARVGYDGPSGVGTPAGIAAFEPPQQANDPGLAQSPRSSPGSPAATSPKGSVAALAIRLSKLALTPRAVAALKRARLKPSQIGFRFTINAAAQVRATLARQVRIKGKARWKPLAISVTIAAKKGPNSRTLRGGNTLASGSYRLTLTPANGSARSIVFRLG